MDISWKLGLLEPRSIGGAFGGRLSLSEWLAGVLGPVDVGRISDENSDYTNDICDDDCDLVGDDDCDMTMMGW